MDVSLDRYHQLLHVWAFLIASIGVYRRYISLF